MLPAILHTLALLIGLCVQSMASPLACSWLFFHLAGCAVLLYNGRYIILHGWVWWATLGWLTTLGVSCFLLAPIPGAASVMFVLASMPSLAICLRHEHVKPYCWCFGSVIVLYAVGLLVQAGFHVTYDNYNLGDRYAWPMLDPNNGAALLNLALIPLTWLMFYKDLRFFFPSVIVAAALSVTGSFAGMIEAAFGLVAITSARYGAATLLTWIIFSMVELVAIFYARPGLIIDAITKFETRFPIWQASWQLLWIRPWFGLGLGSYGVYYHQVRTEDYTGGWFAHNDLLQLAIEMGMPCAAAFLVLIIAISVTSRVKNIVSGITIFAVFMGSMVEFQFYVPAISMVMGLALAVHMLLTPEDRKVIMRP